jgi:alpha,alpha-trehalase
MDYAPALAHIADFWPRIIRTNPADKETLIGLPRLYLVPADGGGTGMFQEMYYWDSFFMSLGVMGTPYEHLIEDIAENFAHLIERFGLIPNGGRYYFTSRSQPPFFTQQIKLALTVKQARGDADTLAWLARMAALAEREHDAVWMGSQQPHHRQVHRGLSRYFDINYLDILASCESGWDHSTRCDERWLLKFLQSGGLVTTLQAAPDKQWAWPNGWAPLQWIVAEGLDRYRRYCREHAIAEVDILF